MSLSIDTFTVMKAITNEYVHVFAQALDKKAHRHVKHTTGFG